MTYFPFYHISSSFALQTVMTGRVASPLPIPPRIQWAYKGSKVDIRSNLTYWKIKSLSANRIGNEFWHRRTENVFAKTFFVWVPMCVCERICQEYFKGKDITRMRARFLIDAIWKRENFSKVFRLFPYFSFGLVFWKCKNSPFEQFNNEKRKGSDDYFVCQTHFFHSYLMFLMFGYQYSAKLSFKNISFSYLNLDSVGDICINSIMFSKTVCFLIFFLGF